MRYYSSALFVVVISICAAIHAVAHTRSIQNTRILNQELVAPNGGMTPPAPLLTTRPAYSRQAWERKIEGVVTVLAEFDADGNAKILRIVKGLGFGLDENATEALQQSRFAPAYRNGRRVSVIANVDVVFSMRQEQQAKLEQALRAAKLATEAMQHQQKLKTQNKP